MSTSQSSPIDMLTALNDAALAITEGLSLPRTLQRIADTARSLAKTKYAALGVLADDGSQLRQFITSGVEPQIARRIDHEPRGEGLLGSIFKNGHAIRVKNISDDSRSAGFCENHPMMTSFLGVPITLRSKRIGNLYLCDRLDEQPFDERDEEMLTLLAAHAAIAIENARLHDDLQAAALRGERDRIGMELHDGVIQSVYAVGMKLEILQAKIQPNVEQHAQFNMILDDLNRIIDDIRAYIRNLITARDEFVTLKTYMENVVTNFRDFSGVQVVVLIDENLPVLSDFQRHNLLQIVREGLANIAHHAEATKCTVAIRKEKHMVFLSIEDNGHGFDADHVQSPANGHFGLHNITQRVKRMGGEMNIDTQHGKGTTVIVRVPIKPA